jgi:hypothetical protein
MPDLLTPERIEEIRERLKKRGLRNFYTHVYADAQVVDAIDDLAALLAHITAQQERIERLEEQNRQLAVMEAEACNRADRLQGILDMRSGLARELEQALGVADIPWPEQLPVALERVAEMASKVERLERILAAEQGREGLEGWGWLDGLWEKSDSAEAYVVELNPCPTKTSEDGEWTDWLPVSWALSYHLDSNDGSAHREELGEYSSALEAMEAAEAALRGDG